MKERVKLLSSGTPDSLNAKVNRFLAACSGTLVDIKYTVTEEAEDSWVWFTALIIYIPQQEDK